MGLFDRLFVDADTTKSKITEVSAVLSPEARLPSVDVPEPDTKSGAKQILESALNQFNDRKVTYLTLANLVSNLPQGSTRETILGVLSATGLSIEEIFKDADDRLDAISVTQQKLQEKVKSDVDDFGNQVVDLKAKIAELESKAKQATKLLSDVDTLANIQKTEINKIMNNVREENV